MTQSMNVCVCVCVRAYPADPCVPCIVAIYKHGIYHDTSIITIYIDTFVSKLHCILIVLQHVGTLFLAAQVVP